MDINGSLLRYIGEAKNCFEESGVNEGDVCEVISWAETAGIKLKGPDGRFLGKKGIGKITVYVEYAVSDGKYEIYNVYSHRVTLVGKED